ncbi:hypothetical protein [Blastococcus mobilis]|uniref:Lipoprotein n=1 Tax=Blastococcus mobilis TaxID=1938746 RepID=A0A238WCV4_9ACTN|nr:hypothetical protein [Blastococcus mobilis]SNR44415.1 hypothetical protein SAMN06272737_107132 [Blastococcus mobilis]
MTIMRVVRPVLTAALLLGLPACAERGGVAAPGTPAPSSSQAAATEGLVLRVEHTGGYATPSMLAARLPLVSVYADGRVITEGPVIEVHPGPALPNLQVQQIARSEVQGLVDRAMAAGVADTFDLGLPPIADAPTTRFTVVTAADTYVREAYALWDTPGGSGLTGEQEKARGKLIDLLSSLTDLGAGTGPYAADVVSAVVSPWVDRGDGLAQPHAPWPGPPLPGETTGGPPDVTCVTATGEEARAVLEAARSANAATPWTTANGMRWSVSFRPLLPDETSCADLAR